MNLQDEIARVTQAYLTVKPDDSLLNLLKRCRVHVAIRAIEGKGDSRDLVWRIDEEIRRMES